MQTKIGTPAEVALEQITNGGAPRRYLACRCSWMRLHHEPSAHGPLGALNPQECPECARHGRRERLYLVSVSVAADEAIPSEAQR